MPAISAQSLLLLQSLHHQGQQQKKEKKKKEEDACDVQQKREREREREREKRSSFPYSLTAQCPLFVIYSARPARAEICSSSSNDNGGHLQRAPLPKQKKTISVERKRRKVNRIKQEELAAWCVSSGEDNSTTKSSSQKKIKVDNKVSKFNNMNISCCCGCWCCWWWWCFCWRLSMKTLPTKWERQSDHVYSIDRARQNEEKSWSFKVLQSSFLFFLYKIHCLNC